MFVLFSVDFSKYMPQCKKAVFSRYFALDDKLYRTAHKNAVTVLFWGKFGIYSDVGTKRKRTRNKIRIRFVWFSVLHTAVYVTFRCFKIAKYVVTLILFNLFKWHIDCALNNAVNLGAKIEYRFA